jgi:hypothetical protein
VADVTVPDDTEFSPGEAFKKVWRVGNSGGCVWGEGAQWVFVSGDRMGAPDTVPVADTLPGATVDISVGMTAPEKPGTYKGIWRLRSASGVYLSGELWVQIIVVAPRSTPVVRITNPRADTGTRDSRFRYSGEDSFGWYVAVTLQGGATDPEDGALGGRSLVWTTDRVDVHKNPPSRRLGTGTTVRTRLYSNEACTGASVIGDWHEITLTATDSDGDTGTAVRRIYIWSNCIY